MTNAVSPSVLDSFYDRGIEGKSAIWRIWSRQNGAFESPPFGAVRIIYGHPFKPSPLVGYPCCNPAGLLNGQKKERKEKAVAEYHRSWDLSKL
jgi:hypothetical protein